MGCRCSVLVMIFIAFLRLYNVDRSCCHVAQSRSLLAVRVQGARWERMLTACPLPRTPRASARLAPAPCRAASAQRLPHDVAAVAAVALALEVGAPRAAAAGAVAALRREPPYGPNPICGWCGGKSY